jgi:hypothetical protein
VDQHVQYVNNNGTYFELVENDVAFIQLSPEEHIRVLTPHQLYKLEDNNYVALSSEDMALFTEETAPIQYVLGENKQYYAISSYPRKYKVYDKGNIKYANIPQEEVIYYKATKKGHAEVPTHELPNMNGRPANNKDYFIYGDEGQYYKADDVYTRYGYQPAETTDGNDDNTVPGTYYGVVGENLNATESDPMFILENGDVIDGKTGAETILYYRSTQNGQKFFGIKLYQWGVDERYASQSDENLIIPVEYERYVAANQIAGSPNFTPDGKDVYVYSDITKEYRKIGNMNEFYFTVTDENGEMQTYRIEFPDRRYVHQLDKEASSFQEYLYVPHPETRYKKAEGETLSGDYIYTNRKYLKLDESPSLRSITKTDDSTIPENGSLNNFYVQADDGGYYPLSAVKIKTSGGVIDYDGATFEDTSGPISINDWQPYSLEETTFNNLFVVEGNSLIRASITESSDLRSFVTPVKNENGTYVFGTDGVYYQVSGNLYADYDLSVDTGDGFIVNGEDGILALSDQEKYVFHGGEYRAIQKVANDNVGTVDGNFLVKGNNYISTTDGNIKVSDSDQRYVKLASTANTLSTDLIAGTSGGSVYVAIKDRNNKTVLKKKIASIASQDSGIIICPDGNYSVSVKDKSLYKTETVKVEDNTGNLHELKDVQVCTDSVTVGDAYDPTGQSNVYAIVSGGTPVRVPKPSEQYTVAANPTGNYVHLGNMYYDKTSNDITPKVHYQNTETSAEIYKALDNNNPNISIYLETTDASKVTVAPVSPNTSGLWFKNKIQRKDKPDGYNLNSLDAEEKEKTALKVGAKYYSMADWKLVVKKMVNLYYLMEHFQI